LNLSGFSFCPYELAGRAPFQATVRVVVVIILDPISYQSQNSFSIGQRIDAHIIALERFHEGFRHAVGLRAGDRREAWLQAELAGKDARFLRCVGAAVVG